MKQFRFVFFLSFLCLSALVNAQTVKQFNGNFDIIHINSRGNLEYDINGLFSDPSNSFSATDAKAGDLIIDVNGSAFKILSASANGSQVNTTVKAFNSTPPFMGVGAISRPTSSGFPLISVGSNPNVLTASVNTATLGIDATLPSFSSGFSLPEATGEKGDVVYFEGDLYRLSGSGWNLIPLGGVPIDPAYPVTDASPGEKGDLIRSMWDNLYYYYNGNTWVAPPTATSLEASAKFGDIFYVTSERKLYMMDDDGVWNNISSSSIPGGSDNDIPEENEPGDLFFNTDKNKLYVYDVKGKWAEISTNGSTPTGIINPDPGLEDVNPGNLFFNTATQKLLVYNGSAWMPLDNLLPEGLIYVGNRANVATPVPMSGDATLGTNGTLTIADKAIGDKKLDKSNIPLSGFGVPLDDIAMGDDYSRFRITNLENPTLGTDAATKHYVDALFGNSSLMLALPNGQFFVGNIGGKAEATPKSAIPLSGFGAPKAPVNFGSLRITNLADPSSPNDGATKNYVDTRVINPGNIRLSREHFFIGSDINTAAEVRKNQIPLSGFGLPVQDLAMGEATQRFRITNLATPLDERDAVTKGYVDSKVLGSENLSLKADHFFIGDASGKAVETAQSGISISGFGAAQGAVDMGSQTIENLADPLGPQDASTKQYVDQLFESPSTLLSLDKGQLFMGNESGRAEGVTKKSIALSDFGKATAPLDMGAGFTISNLGDPLFDQDAATKNYVDRKLANPGSLGLSQGALLIGNSVNLAEEVQASELALSAFGPAGSDIALGDGQQQNRIVFLADPQDGQDAATKAYVDSRIPETPSGDTLPDSPKPGDLFYHTSEQILYVYDGKDWVALGKDENGMPILDLPEGQFFVGNQQNLAAATAKADITLSGFGPAQGDVAMGNEQSRHKLTELADPENPQDAATKAYVDLKSSQAPSGENLPESPKIGEVFYHTGERILYVYDGQEWTPVSAAGSGGSIIDLPEGMFYIGGADSKAMPIAKSGIPLSGFGSAQDTLAMNNFRIGGLATPQHAQDAATKSYVDSKSTGTGAVLPSAPSPGDVFFNTDDNRIYVYNGSQWVGMDNTLPQDQFYVGDARNRAVPIEKEAISISGFGTATAHVSMGNGTDNFKITNLATPTEESDAASKGYVDNIREDMTGGYMKSAIYDSNQDSIVDVAATVNGFTVESHVPEQATFTDERVKIGAEGAALYLSAEDFQADASGTEIVLKKMDLGKLDPIEDGTLLGNNLGGASAPVALTAEQVKALLALERVDNTADEDKHVFSAGRLSPAIKINGKDFDGSSDIDLGDDLGNHTATENIKTATHSISSDGAEGKGLYFQTPGHGIFQQDLTVNGNFYTPSDERLKTHIQLLSNALMSLDQLDGVRFEYKDQSRYAAGAKIGLIAQQLQAVFPEMVSMGEDGFLKVDYTQLGAVLLQAIKEQQALITAQSTEIQQLREQVDRQQSQLDQIFEKLNLEPVGQ